MTVSHPGQRVAVLADAQNLYHTARSLYSRNIDYDAVDDYRDQGVYLRNSASDAHTACVTVRADDGGAEEPSSSPPVERIGYAVQPGMEVEIFRFEEPGQYTIDVAIEATEQRETFRRSPSSFADADVDATTFEITDATTIRVTASGDA